MKQLFDERSMIDGAKEEGIKNTVINLLKFGMDNTTKATGLHGGSSNA